MNKELLNIICQLEDKHDETQSFVLLTDLTITPSTENLIIENTDIFFMASRSRLLLVHWVIEEVREIFEKANFESLEISNEVYEKLRTVFNTKAFNRTRLLQLFKCENSKTILNYEQFLKIESDLIDKYNSFVTNDMKLSKINHVYILPKNNTVDYKKEISEFLKKPRQEELISLRAKGLTLDEVGERFDITRERARQIEIKPKALIERWLEDNHEALLKDLGKNIIINPKKANTYFGTNIWEIIKYTIMSNRNKISNWYYIKELNTIAYSKNNQFYKDMIDLVKDACCKNKEISDLLTTIHECGYNFVDESILKEFVKHSSYKLYGTKLFAGKLSIGDSIVVAAETEYSNGVNIGDKKELAKFADYLNKTFELDVKVNRALTARIQDVLIMSGNAIYKSPKFILSTKELDDVINTYIANMSDDRTTYQSLFEELPNDLLNKHGIYNHSGLHGYIKKHEDDLNVISLRYYVCKKNTEELLSKGFFVKLANWLLDKKCPVKMDEILKEFPDWTNMYPKYAMIYFPEIVQWDKQTYYNIKSINLTDEELNLLDNLIKELTQNELKYTNIYILYNKAKTQLGGLLESKKIDNENKLYQVIKYYLQNKNIVFSKPHILKDRTNITDYSTEDLINEVIGRKDIVSKTWLKINVYKYYGERNSSLSLAFHKVLKDYLRLDEDKYVKSSRVKFNKNEIQEINNFIIKNMQDGKYVIPSKITFADLPQCSYKWSSWLLCDIIKKYNMSFKVLNRKKNAIFNTMIIVKDTDTNFNSREDIFEYCLQKDFKNKPSDEELLKYTKSLGIYPSNVSLEDIEESVNNAFKKN